MSLKRSIILVGLILILFLASCGDYKLARIKSKAGESCLLEHKCQIMVLYGEATYINREAGGVVVVQADHLYRCYVADDFYNNMVVGETFKFDPNSKNCQEINP